MLCLSRGFMHLIHPHEGHSTESMVMADHRHGQEPPEAPLQSRVLLRQGKYLKEGIKTTTGAIRGGGGGGG